MSDFATKTTKPSAKEYLDASESELIERLNNNPTGHQSEFPFMQSVIAVRTAESQRKTNEKMVRHTRNLVWATWALSVITIITLIVSIVCG